MFEHIRAQLDESAAEQQRRIDQAKATQTAAANAVTAAQSSLTTAQTSVTSSQQDLTAAEARVSAARADRDAKQSALSSAQRAADAWAADEPDAEGPFGKPAPGRAVWQRKMTQLNAAVSAAQSELTAATAALTGAAQARDAANQQLDARRADLAARQSDVARAQQALAACQPTIDLAQQAAQGVQHQITALEQRAARFLAQPLDVVQMRLLADEEQDQVVRLRRHRADLRGQRATALDQRAAVFAAHDDTVDDLAALASQLHAPALPAYPEVADVANQLDPLVAASRQQRTRPGAERADDLAGESRQLQALLARLQNALTRATADRDTKAQKLQQAIDEMNAVNGEAP